MNKNLRSALVPLTAASIFLNSSSIVQNGRRIRRLRLGILVGFWLLLAAPCAKAQILYACLSGGPGGEGGVIFMIDLATCEACPVAEIGGVCGVPDILVLPDGNLLVISICGIFILSMPDGTLIWSDPLPPSGGGSVLGPDGMVYLSTTLGLSVFDPNTYTLTFLGNWPPSTPYVGELFFANGNLYAITPNPPSVILEVNVSAPDSSVIVVTDPPFSGIGGFTTGIYHSAGNFKNIYQYDIETNTDELICDLSFLPNGIIGLSEVPDGVEILPCPCTTFAGTVSDVAYTLCINSSAVVPYNDNATLNNGDLLQYILFSDPSDTLGSIVSISNTPSIPFDPATLQTNVVYYLATIAGNNLNGNVDFDDPCFDISDIAAQVIWMPQPTVSFSVANAFVCAGDCRTIMAEFTGTPPFVLTYTSVAGTFTQTFMGSSGSFQVCVPVGVSPGPLSVQATILADAWCVCE